MIGFMQVQEAIDQAQDIVAIPNENFTIFGVLLLVILALTGSLIYTVKKYNASVDLNIKITGKYEAVASQLLTTMNDIKNYLMVKK